MKFEQQINYFRKKLNVTSESYQDVWGEEHDYMFAVAGANRNDLVADLRKAVDAAIADGLTPEEFSVRFNELAAQYGWSPRGNRKFRIKTIYDTNVFGSYSRGRLEQQLKLKKILPYWQYHHHSRIQPRLEHKAWDGLILHADDPWWELHYPVKAYNCHCTVTAHSEDELRAMGRSVDSAPLDVWRDVEVGKQSGASRMVRVPTGVDPGFERTDFSKLGEDRRASIDKVLMQKMVNTPPRTAATAVRNVLSYPAAMRLMSADFKKTVDNINKTKRASGEFKYVGVIPEDVVAALEARAVPPQSAVIAIRGDDILHALRDHKSAAGVSLPVEFWQQLPAHLMQPDAILLETDQALPTLLFVYKTEGGKVAIKVNYEVKVRNAETGKKERVAVNMVRTGGVVETEKQWESLKAYEVLWGVL